MDDLKRASDASDGIFQDESLRIKDFLKKNARGMNIREISEALQINRNSVAKYLDVLTIREEVEFKIFGKSKVYFLSQHVPASALGRFFTNLMVILNRDRQIVQINDAFLGYMNLPRESVMGSDAREINCLLLEDSGVIAWSEEALLGKEMAGEISFAQDGALQHFRVVITPTQFPDNTPGIILFFENITEKKQIRAALAESEQNFRTLIEGSGDGCLILDEKGTVIAWNTAMEKISGIPQERSTGSSILDIVAELIVPEYRTKKQIERIKQGMLSLFQGKASPFRQYPDDIPIMTKDGQRRYIQQMSFPVRIGRKMHYGVIIRDVTERRHMQDALVREKAFQNAVMDNVMGIFFVIDEREHFIRWNRNLETITGYNTYELLRLGVTDILAPEDRDYFRRTYGTILNEEIPGMMEMQIQTKDRRKIPFLVNSVTTEIAEKKYRVGLGIDISNRKRQELLLRESEAKFRRIVETANEGIWVMDRNFITTFVNGTLADLLGFYEREIIGRPVTDFMHPDDRADHAVRVQNRRGGRKETYERHLVRKDGSSCWVLVSAAPLAGADGNFDGSFAMLSDITQRRQAEQVLRALFRGMVGTTGIESLRNITENICSWLGADCVMIGEIKPDGATVKVLAMHLDGNDVENFSYSLKDTPCEDVASKGFCSYPDHARDLFPRAKDLADLNIRGYAGTPLRTSNGRTVGILCILSRNSLNVDPMTREILDIFAVKASAEIERKRAEDALAESTERFDQVANNADEWIWEVDAEGLYRYSSAAVERILGYLPDEIVGNLHYYDLFEPADRDALLLVTQEAFAGHEPFRKFINANRHKNGRTVILETSGTPVFNGEGKFTGYRGCDTDITERRNLEMARQDALRQIEKNIEQFAALGDHIRNPLTVILAEAGNLPEGSEKTISVQVREIDRIIRQIDRGWIESDAVRSFLRRYYEIESAGGMPANGSQVPDPAGRT